MGESLSDKKTINQNQEEVKGKNDKSSLWVLIYTDFHVFCTKFYKEIIHPDGILYTLETKLLLFSTGKVKRKVIHSTFGFLLIFTAVADRIATAPEKAKKSLNLFFPWIPSERTPQENTRNPIK
jgi:hypothetical protein